MNGRTPQQNRRRQIRQNAPGRGRASAPARSRQESLRQRGERVAQQTALPPRRSPRKQARRKLLLRIGLGAAILAIVILLISLLLPNKPEGPALTPGDIIDSAQTAITGDASDMSYLQREAKIRYNAINEPYMYGDEILFSATGGTGSISYTKLVIYDTKTEESYTIPAKVRYNNLTSLVMNEHYIAYCDSSAEGGGRVCFYNRKTEEFKTVKDYAYGMPKLALSGSLLAFLQQAGEETDRLYVCDLATGETVTPKVFEGSAAAQGGIHLQDGVLTYAVSYYEGDIHMSRVTQLDLYNGRETSYDWERVVYQPESSGNYIAFLSAASGVNDDLYLSERGGAPQLLVSDVTNMQVGEGFVCYTKDEVVYAYIFENGKTFRLNSAVSKGLLSQVTGKNVCWYDITSYDDVNIVKYAQMQW